MCRTGCFQSVHEVAEELGGVTLAPANRQHCEPSTEHKLCVPDKFSGFLVCLFGVGYGTRRTAVKPLPSISGTQLIGGCMPIAPWPSRKYAATRSRVFDAS